MKNQNNIFSNEKIMSAGIEQIDRDHIYRRGLQDLKRIRDEKDQGKKMQMIEDSRYYEPEYISIDEAVGLQADLARREKQRASQRKRSMHYK